MLRGSLPYLALALALFGIELVIACSVRDTIVRPYLGDVLCVPLAHCLVMSFARVNPRRLVLGVFLFACTIEVLQALDYVALLGLEHHAWLSIALGRTFQWGDFLAYGLGALLVLAGERTVGAP